MSSSDKKEKPRRNGDVSPYDLKTSIKETYDAMSLCLSNKFTEARLRLEPHADESMYHALGYATISYLQAIMTYEQEVIEVAYKCVKRALEVCDRFRRKTTWTESLYSWVGRPYFDDYSEEEIHAELCYAECLLERAMLTFIQDENLINFIKGGLKIRNAYHLYKSCLLLMDQCPKSLLDSDNREDFEGGVHLGVGTFNLLLSVLPARILRLLEWVGFSGNKKYGLNHLGKGVDKDGIRSPLCAVTLLGYHTLVSPILGIGDTDVDYSQSILDACLKEYPEGAIFLFYQGRLRAIQGKLEEAISCYNKSLELNIDWKQVHHVCYWELMWCHSFQCDWSQAAYFASTLAAESKWSKTAYLYLEASFRLMAVRDEYKNNIPREKTAKIEELLRLVPNYKQRIAGKSLPFEKFAVYKAKKYFDGSRGLVLPGLELIYVWNGFDMFGTRKELVNNVLKLVLGVQTQLEADKDSNPWYVDDHCLCKVLQGVCLRHLGYPEEAESCFREVIDSRSSILLDNYLVPFASGEIGFLYKKQERFEEAIEQFEYTRKHYTGYHLESRLHFRIHSNLQVLRDGIMQEDENEQVDSPEPLPSSESVSTALSSPSTTSRKETTV